LLWQNARINPAGEPSVHLNLPASACSATPALRQPHGPRHPGDSSRRHAPVRPE
jgi:hypothetical protein